MTDCRKCELNNACPGFDDCPKMTTTTELIELIDGLRNNGDDCKCGARGFSECGCSANWSELHAEKAADLLEAQAKQIEAFTGVDRINVDLHAKVQALQADADRYRWLKNNCVLGIKQFGLGWSLSTRQGIAPDSLRDVDAAIDANRKGNA